MLAAVGCSSKNDTQTTPPAEEEAADMADTQETETGENNTVEEEPENTEGAEASEQSTLTGTLDEVKDFMFVVTDSEGTPYAFPFEGEKPSGLEDLKSGDEVIVTYTGELSEVDNFEGEIISIEKVK